MAKVQSLAISGGQVHKIKAAFGIVVDCDNPVCLTSFFLLYVG
jgi:hypothetical protein